MPRRAACALLGVLLCVGSYFAIQRYRYRFVRSDNDLFELLPYRDATVFFVNVGILRQTGFLNLVAGPAGRQESDYARFVGQTGFDYTRDLDAVAGTTVHGATQLAARGRFDWSRLKSYATQNGGVCSGDACRMQSADRGRRIALRRVQPDVVTILLASSSDAAVEAKPDQDGGGFAPPSKAPVWIRPAHAVLSDPSDLPLPVRIFAISLQSADTVLLTLEQASENGAAFDVDLLAAFQNGPTAETARQQLQSSTRLMQAGLAERARGVPDPATLEWLLVAGKFEVRGNQLSGHWPVRRELLNSLR